MPLTRDQLDFMASHHYATGRRRKRAFAEPVILGGNCHVGAGCRAYHDAVTFLAVIDCHACDRFVADVATTGPAPGIPRGQVSCPKCPDDTPVLPRYWFRTGLLELECQACGNVFASIPVQGETEEN